MAIDELAVRIRLIDARLAQLEAAKTERAIDRVGRSAGGAGRRAKESAGGFHKMGSGLGFLRGSIGGVLGLAGLGGLAIGIKDVVQAGMGWQEQQAQLQNALHATGQASAANTKMLNAAIEAQSTHGGFAPQQEAQALTQLVRATGSATKARKDLSLATNISRGTHKDFLLVTKAVAMAEQGRTVGLSRLGIAIPKVTAATDALKAAHWRATQALAGLRAAHIKVSAAQAAQAKVSPMEIARAKALDVQASKLSALGRLQKLYGGATAAFSKKAAGAISNFNNTLDMLKEKIGVAILPYVTKLAKWLTHVVNVVTQHWPEIVKVAKPIFQAVGKIVSGWASKVGAVIEIVSKWVKGHHKLVVQIIGYIKVAVHVLAEAFKRDFEAVKIYIKIALAVFTFAFGVIQGTVKVTIRVVNWLAGAAQTAFGAVKAAVHALAWPWVHTFNVVKQVVTTVIDWVVKKIDWVIGKINDLTGTLSGATNSIADFLGIGGGTLNTGPIHVGARTAGIGAAVSSGPLRAGVLQAVGSGRNNSSPANAHQAPGGRHGVIDLHHQTLLDGRVLAESVTRYGLRMQAHR